MVVGRAYHINDKKMAMAARHILLITGAALVLASCGAGPVPDSAAGVGFGDYDVYAEQQRLRDAELEGRTVVAGPAGTDVIADVPTVLPATGPSTVTNETGISAENDFNAVTGQRSIEDDAALIARNRAQYVVVQPTDLPARPGSTRPNIVEYALRTNNPLGVALYSRGRARPDRFQRACALFPSSDVAQEEFLLRGGPERDRLGVDPDGDGYACNWNPEPFRLVRQATPPEPEAEGLETQDATESAPSTSIEDIVGAALDDAN